MERYDQNVGPVVDFLSYGDFGSPTFPSLYTEGYFQWKIRDNPFGPSACFLRSRDGIPVAHCSVTAKPWNEALGAGVGCAELGDTHTHPAHQRQGHFGALGSHTISSFDQSHPLGAKLIYGLPNDNALPGWIRRCSCEVYSGAMTRELVRGLKQTPGAVARQGLNRLLTSSARSLRRFRLCEDRANIMRGMDRLWAENEDIGSFLVKKDGAWWDWRYRGATEKYCTYALIDAEAGDPLAYVVVKMGRHGTRFMRICDVIASVAEIELDAFRLFLEQEVRPTDSVMLWAQESTEIEDIALSMGFTKTRDVPLIFFKNEAYAELVRGQTRLRLSLGDTDNV
jgi:hypothetical protein